MNVLDSDNQPTTPPPGSAQGESSNLAEENVTASAQVSHPNALGEQEEQCESERTELPPDLVLAEFQRFWKFKREIIDPFEKTQKHAELSDFHKQLMYTSCQMESVTASPRGVLKSHIMSRCRTLHKLVDPNREIYGDETPEILLISEGGDLPKEHVGWIKDHVENNPYLKKKYGTLYDPKLTWNENEAQLANGSSVKAKGITSAIRGKHPTDAVCDDVESENNVNTDETLGSIKKRFWRVIWPMRRAGNTSLHFVGTVLRNDSLLADLLRTGEFHGKKWRALFEDPKNSTREDGLCSIWPQYWSVEWLLKQRRRMGVHMFNAEYQNEPVGLGDIIIDPNWIKRFNITEIAALRPVRRYMAVDPAFTEEKWGCHSAIVVLTELESGHVFETMSWRGKITGPALCRQIIATYRHLTSDGVECVLGVEEVAAQKMVSQAIREQEPDIQIVPVRPTKDKTMRLISVSRYVENGIVRFESERLITNLLSAPTGPMDEVDALVWALKLYEMNHPVLADGASVEIDTLKDLDDTSLACYVDRAKEGSPFHTLPGNWAKKVAEAEYLQEYVESMMEY